ncbi:alpha/beta fold hydrolase [Nocardia goodfellowii]
MTTLDLEFALTGVAFAPPAVIGERTVEVDGLPISARLAAVPRPRAVLLALHGGATTSAYFDCPGHPRLSLLRLASALGFTVLALDRPGYGESFPHAPRLTDPDHIVEVIHEAAEQHLRSLPRGAGTFLMGHSAGAPHAVRLAASKHGTHLLGLELAGTGREHHAAAAAILGTGRPADPDAVRGLLWRPEHLYPAEMLGGAPIAANTPRYEGTVLRPWPQQDFPALAAKVRVPVHFSAGQYENVWRNDADALAEIAALFTAAPRVVAEQLPASGHNLSLGYSATAYHLRVLAFVEECVRAQEVAEQSGSTTQSKSRDAAAQEVNNAQH